MGTQSDAIGPREQGLSISASGFSMCLKPMFVESWPVGGLAFVVALASASS